METRLLRHDDLSDALALGRSAGWNQTLADWRRLIEYEPHGCFVTTDAGHLIGTVTTTTYGAAIGWIGMMLVDPQFRRRGIATQLMQNAWAYLHRRSVEQIFLDATPLGRPVYERLGFRCLWDYQRWSRDESSPPQTTTRNNIPFESLSKSQFALDQIAFGANRDAFLQRLQRDSFVVVDTDGFGMLRKGSLADYMGPVVARDRTTAGKLMKSLLQLSTTTVFWDLPQTDPATEEMAHAMGFVPVRRLTRMSLDPTHRPGNIDLQFAIADPGTG